MCQQDREIDLHRLHANRLRFKAVQASPRLIE
jgi:hypothetical protein